MRDQVLCTPSSDVDVEVYGLDPDALEAVLATFGSVMRVGRAFGVFLVRGLGVDISLPREDPTAPNGTTLERSAPQMSFEQASRRRDLTVNSMGWDPLTGALLDPHGGVEDLERRRLRATDRELFGSDPLRGLRVAQLAARFELTPDDELVGLCAALDLSDVAAERFLGEFRKLLLASRRPSRGLAFLAQTGLLAFFPELAAMEGVVQDPIWHPEGDVWRHTLMVVDEAAQLKIGDRSHDEALLFGALCHDMGKPATTVLEGERVRSPAHDIRGVAVAAEFLSRLAAPAALSTIVGSLVRHHLAPALLAKQGSQPKAYRRLSRRLAASGASMELLERVARADHLGRTTADAMAREFPAGDAFLVRARALSVEAAAPRDCVLGRHVLERGIAPGPAVGRLLLACREIQDQTGWNDPDRILDAALEAGS